MFVNKKKVCLIYKKLSNYGGQERFILNLYNYLSKNGWDVALMVGKVEKPINARNVIAVPYIPFPPWLRTLSFSLSAYIQSNTMRKRGYITFGFGKTFCTDVFRAGGGVHLKYAHQSLLRFRNPLSITYHRLKRMLSPYHHTVLLIEKINFKCKSTKVFIAPSKMVKQDLVEYFGISESRITVIYNEVDRSVFNSRNKNKARKTLERILGIHGFLFLFASTNHMLKGLDYLIDAFKVTMPKIPSAKLLIAGSGQEKYFTRKIRKMGLNGRIIVLGRVKDMSLLYRGSDVLIYPSLFDASSNVVIEAMACGLPVAVSKHTGYYELVESSGGGVVINDPTNIAELSEILTDIYNKTPAELSLLGNRGEQYIEKINANQLQRIEEILNELIPGGP